jgi:fructose-1,6-bisphosphatase/inositol monophosphatase family enzyme
VYSVAKLIRGSYICYIARVSLWDLAGAVPILERLGFVIVSEHGGEVDSRVHAEQWVLDADHPRLWKSVGLLFIAADRTTLAYMREHYHSGR